MTKKKPKDKLRSPRYEISEEEAIRLYEIYLDDNSIQDVMDKTGYGRWAINYAFNKFEFPLRTRSERSKLAVKQGKITGSPGRMEKARNWQGGRIKDSYGYIHIKMHDHPRASKNGYVREHVLVWEKYHNKSLPDGWHIHHINGNKSDNRIENLLAMPSKKHMRLIPELTKRISELEEENKQLKMKIEGS